MITAIVSFLTAWHVTSSRSPRYANGAEVAIFSTLARRTPLCSGLERQSEVVFHVHVWFISITYVLFCLVSFSSDGSDKLVKVFNVNKHIVNYMLLLESIFRDANMQVQPADDWTCHLIVHVLNWRRTSTKWVYRIFYCKMSILLWKNFIII